MIFAVISSVSTVFIVRDTILSVQKAIHSVRDPKAVESAMRFIKENDAKWVSIRFTDTLTTGVVQYLSGSISNCTEKMFAGSFIEGGQPINESEVRMILDPGTCVGDPIAQQTMATRRCSIDHLAGDERYAKDLRNVYRKAKDNLPSSSNADTDDFSPESEFFNFDGVQWSTHID